MKRNKAKDPVADDRKRNDALNKSKNQSTNLPGDYPPGEDIMIRKNSQRAGMDVENFSRVIGPENYMKPNEPVVTDPNDIREEPGLDTEDPPVGEMERPVPRDLEVEGEDDVKSESDVTREDLEALGPRDLSMDMGEDEQILKNRVWPVDMAGDDLDVPGADLDDDNERIGSEDEENNPYSIGGDRNEDKLEGK